MYLLTQGSLASKRKGSGFNRGGACSNNKGPKQTPGVGYQQCFIVIKNGSHIKLDVNVLFALFYIKILVEHSPS